MFNFWKDRDLVNARLQRLEERVSYLIIQVKKLTHTDTPYEKVMKLKEQVKEITTKKRGRPRKESK